ncbi:NADH-ubiquinone oxidoreductase-F iron-sulfur binding region domain-containing protein [Nocardioides sp. GY 10127]|uniref:NADH-ubiquinone oxidoreductase-F iron-sulfur binding region domain-containing protein n=1 Tax=Nocardioides sp. GY 10127 TaxID=2569762 RepID=UPI0010A8E63C|nr:NADH-ubiquinone oxidoreductase-F iron-sulfur binding region domain-containing protein [Nocardioides sp. GY 10127]TIC79321.1 oxidoreductase [Nocardioides sp. GY 10127]
MTVTDPGTLPALFPATPPLLTLGEPRLLAAAPPAVPSRDRAWLVHAATDVRLLGRGGAAFPVARKLASVPLGARVLVNASEGEPASFKDRALMRHSPDLVVAGIRLVAAALGSGRPAVVAVEDEPSAQALAQAAGRAGAELDVRLTRHGFVGGEIGALVNGMEGRAPRPDGRRVLPTERGLAGRPTFASNVETFAQLALLSALGPAGYAAVGPAHEPGTSLTTVLGATPVNGVVEVPHGTALRDLVGHDDGPVLVGGYHGTWAVPTGARVSRVELRERAIGWGAGVLAVLPADTCPVAEVARVTDWLAEASARQCGPCVFGLRAVADDVQALAQARPVDLERLQARVGMVRGRGACHHPTGATGFVASALTVFAEDVARHRAGHHCGRADLGVLPTTHTTGGVR